MGNANSTQTSASTTRPQEINLVSNTIDEFILCNKKYFTVNGSILHESSRVKCLVHGYFRLHDIGHSLSINKNPVEIMSIVEKYIGAEQATIYTNSSHIPKTVLFNLPLHINTFKSKYTINEKPCSKIKISFKCVFNNCKHKTYGGGGWSQFGLIGFGFKGDSQLRSYSKDLDQNKDKDKDKDACAASSDYGYNYGYKQGKYRFDCRFQSDRLFNFCRAFSRMDKDDMRLEKILSPMKDINVYAVSQDAQNVFDLRMFEFAQYPEDVDFKQSFINCSLGKLYISIGDTIEFTISETVTTRRAEYYHSVTPEKYLSLEMEIVPSDERKIRFGACNEKSTKIDLTLPHNRQFEYIPAMVVNGCDCVKQGGVGFEVQLQQL